MADPGFILFDDETARGWEPYALTRPAGELVFGALTTRERVERILGVECAGHLAADHLRGFAEPGAAPVLEETDIEGPVLVLLSRFIPEWDPDALRAVMDAEDHTPLMLEDVAVGLWIPAGQARPAGDILAAANEAPDHSAQVQGWIIERVWDLCLGSPEQLTRDIEHLCRDQALLSPPPGVHVAGQHPVHVGAGVEIEPGVVFDTSGGPVWLRENVQVRALTRIAGPAYVGPGSTLLGGAIEAVSVGPVCKVRGELADTVCLGYVNKAHDGHIGHAYLGRWVNLGAGTTNSDLKNNYGSIRIDTGSGPVDTGEIKLGCLLGDHVKTAIGLLLNTGTVVGAGSNLFGAEMPPKRVPPFRWGHGGDLVPFKLEKFLEVAERAMERRDVGLGDRHRDQLRASWERGCRQAGDPGAEG